jgi:hypothetical protein
MDIPKNRTEIGMPASVVTLLLFTTDGLGVVTIDVGCTVVERMEGMSDGTSDGESETKTRVNDGPGVSVGPSVGTKLGTSDVVVVVVVLSPSSTIVNGTDVGMVDDDDG